MPGLKDIKQKIKGVATTQQITRAMKMMSTARLGRAMEQIDLTHAYISRLEQIVYSIRSQLPEKYHHPCLIPREVNTSAYVMIGGERGLCGGFNQDINRFARKVISESEAKNKKVIVIGKKAVRFFSKLSFEVIEKYPELNIRSAHQELFDVAEQIFYLFRSGKVDEVSLIYTSFISPTRKYPVVSKLLPLDTSQIQDRLEIKSNRSFDFVPSPTVIFDQLIPRFLRNLLHKALIESSAAEQSARMAAMTSATDRAQEIIDELQLDCNRSRQALITQQIAEVISGTEA
ncbi:MAG: ATP synthase F1 subunit gamma [Candidatus Rifleibacteriota bacterium]